MPLVRKQFPDARLQGAYSRALATGRSWSRLSGNGSRFWKGYDMAVAGNHKPIYVKDSLAHAYWCAGQDMFTLFGPPQAGVEQALARGIRS